MTKDITRRVRIRKILEWLLLIGILVLCAWLIWIGRVGWLVIWWLIGGGS